MAVNVAQAPFVREYLSERPEAVGVTERQLPWKATLAVAVCW